MQSIFTDTICALATSPGVSAIAVVRLSGIDAITIADSVFEARKKGKKLINQPSHTIHLGVIKDENNAFLDEALVSVFKTPHSYTGENVVEISTHGSSFIQQKIIALLLGKGVRLATAGEFTMRAFLNNKMDLSQAEAVADLIASDSENSHKLAVNQMRGGFSEEINKLRTQLIKFASLIELELDFGEEDVEFADRTELKTLIYKVQKLIKYLIESFTLGNVIKNGVPVAIVGEPNVGKSTLLNTILNENRAIVSDIAGTTRDTIEDEVNINGTLFRFIDTAGLRKTTDSIEAFGIEKTYQKIGEATIILYLFDVNKTSLKHITKELANIKNKNKTAQVVLIANKTDIANTSVLDEFKGLENLLFISAKLQQNVDAIKTKLTELMNLGVLSTNNTVVSNSRHFESLKNANKSLNCVLTAMDTQLTSDIIAMDIREALHHLGLITGAITTDDLLDSIFRDFCIGK